VDEHPSRIFRPGYKAEWYHGALGYDDKYLRQILGPPKES